MGFFEELPRRGPVRRGCGIQACLALLAVITLALVIFGATGMRGR